MYRPVRPIHIHRLLFGIAAILAVCAVPHALTVYTQDLPSALLNLHLTACVIVSINAELRRQWWMRCQTQRELTELVANAERASR